MAMTNGQLRAVMRFQLSNFNDENVTIGDGTKHEEVLSDSDGFGAANSKALYKGAIRWTFSKQKMKDPEWPKDWMEMSVADLADKFIPS